MPVKFKTCVRYNEPGHAHALTFSCFHKQPLFTKDKVKDLFIRSLESARTKHNLLLWAYVIMPDHVHLLIFPQSDNYSISSMLAGIKRPVAFWANSAGHCTAPQFWQAGGGFDRNINSAKAAWAEIDYLHHNPVRRGLCASPEQWRYSSAAYLTGAADVPIKMDPLAIE
jgi:putative transposase